MKKYFLSIAVVLSIATLLVYADDGPGSVACFWEKLTPQEINDFKKNGNIEGQDLENKVRGTCKYIEVQMTVSVDPALKGDYLLAVHSPVPVGAFSPTYEYKKSRYSESLYPIRDVESITETSEGEGFSISHFPDHYVLLDKDFTLGYISQAFEKAKLAFSTNALPLYLSIDIYNTSEIEKSDSSVENYFKHHSSDGEVPVLDIASTPNRASYDQYVKSGLDLSSLPYKIVSFDYKGFGKHIFGPKSDIVESQYVAVDKGNFIEGKDLGLTVAPAKHGDFPVVPVTSPLTKIADYWIFTKRNGELVLQWQKSEYTLDDGGVRVAKYGDKKMNIVDLQKLEIGANTTTTATVASSASVATSNVGTTIFEGVHANFLTKIIDTILSWFK
jgi:hypothetical protein